MSSNNTSSNIIFQTANIDSKIYIKEQKGALQQKRRILATLLILVFIALPFLQYHGKQAILFDLNEQKLHLFSLILYPQDLLIFVYIFIISAFLLFYISSRYGRVWCGYICPQTIWNLIFFWVQFRVEGNYQAQKSLDKLSPSLSKVSIKIIKHSLWLIISFITATTFISYFMPVKQLYLDLVSGTLGGLYWQWILFFMVCTYINAGWIKEKMCEHMCPYSRFQSVMINSSTKIISYNDSRGEPRAPRKLSKEKPSQLGDCVDCNQCVQVCPVGIDIRKGFQYECISCGLCIDACDQVMSRFKYPKGLISFKAEQQAKKRYSAAYIGIIAVFTALFILWFTNRSLLEVSITKDRNVLYRVTNEQRIENTYTLKLTNKTQNTETVTLNIEGTNGLELEDNSVIHLDADSSKVVIINVLSSQDHSTKFLPFTFSFTTSTQKLTSKAIFHGK